MTEEIEPAFALETSYNGGRDWIRVAGGLDARSMHRLVVEQTFDGFRLYRIRETPDVIVWSHP